MLRLPLSRRAIALVVAALCGTALFPMLDAARASRQQPAAVAEAPHAHEAHFHDHPGSVTLGAMIDIQKRRRALGPAQASAGISPVQPGWEAQLGAFGSVAAAERQQAKLPKLPLPVAIHRDGALYRLKSMSGPSADSVRGVCDAANAAGLDCFVRRAEGS